MNREDFPPVISVPQAAKIMGVGVTKMYEIAKRPDFPKIPIDLRTVRINRDLFFQWIDKITQEGMRFQPTRR